MDFVEDEASRTLSVVDGHRIGRKEGRKGGRVGGREGGREGGN